MATKRISAKQKRLLDDLEKGEKTVDRIFEDHRIPMDRLDDWLDSAAFKKAIEDMRGRMRFRLEQDLFRGAVVAAKRLGDAAYGSRVGDTAGNLTSVEAQACANALRMFLAIVQNPQMRREAAAALRELRKPKLEDLTIGYHPSHTPQRAAALLARIRAEEERAARGEVDQDEEGHYVHTD
ncbi:MAG: hypothetical protein WBD40_08705 [Tepidisphaeraceae bacterium]